MRALLCAAPPLGGSPIALFFLSCHPPAAIVITVPLVTPLCERKWINRNVCHSEDERRPAANGSAVMRQVWASLEWGGECENRQRDTHTERETPRQRGCKWNSAERKELKASRRVSQGQRDSVIEYAFDFFFYCCFNFCFLNLVPCSNTDERIHNCILEV